MNERGTKINVACNVFQAMDDAPFVLAADFWALFNQGDAKQRFHFPFLERFLYLKSLA